jgi:hypothetical protein
MTQYHARISQFSLLAMSACLAGWIGLASAKEGSSVLVQKNSAPAAVAPKLVPPANSANTQPLPPPLNPNAQSVPQHSTAVAPKQPFMRPAEPRRRVPATTALAITEESMPAPTDPRIIVPSADVEVRPAPPIEYDTDGDARGMYRKSGEVNLVMITQNPADGCYYEIPLCIPACCTDEPRISGGRGILGRGVVEYCWECGFRAEVKFRHRLGDVKVEYEGD